MANEATEKFIDTIRKAAEAYSDQLASAAGDAALLQRVQIARMPVDYVQIEHARHDTDKIGEFDHQSRTIKPKPDFAKRVKRFMAAGEAVNVMTGAPLAGTGWCST